MKNFRQFTVAALMIGAIGFTSCVSDEISPEVKALYENQAAYLSAQTSLINAEAALEEAQLAYQLLQNEALASDNAVDAAQNALALAAAQNALELAQEEHIQALLELKLQIEAAKSEKAQEYLGEYLAQRGQIISLQSDISDENILLSSLNAAQADGIYTTEEAIELKNIELTLLQGDLEEQQAKLVLLEAVLSDPSSIGNQVLEIQKQIDELEALNKEISARIVEIETTELSAYADDLADYIVAKGDVQTETANVQNSNDTLTQLNEDLEEAESELSELTGGATITYAQALLNKSNAESDFDEKEEIYNGVSALVADYSTLINDIATASATIAANEETIDSIEADLVDLESDYNTAKAIFDANPSGTTVTSIGADNRAGEANDSSTVTYYEVTDDSTNPLTLGNTAYFSFADLPNGSSVGTTNGTYFDVEADDTTITNALAFDNAQAAFIGAQVALSDAQAELAENQEELVELQEAEAEFDTTLIAQIETARAERDAASDALTLATDVVTAIEAVASLEDDIALEEVELEKAEQALSQAESEVARLEVLVGDTELAAYTALLDQVDALNLEVTLNDSVIDNLQGDIIYFEGLELELEATNYDGTDYEERMEEIADAITSEQEAIIVTNTAIKTAQNDLLKLASDVTDLEEELLADISAAEARIILLEAEIAERTKLAENYLALMNQALDSIL